MKLVNGIAVFGLFSSLGAFAQSSPQPVTPSVSETLDRLMKVNSSGLKCTLNKEIEYVCDSMSTLACKPGTFDDGTGKVLSNEDYQAKVDPMKVKVKGFYRESILKMLKNDDPKYALVRELSMKATNQIGTPECSSSKKSEIQQCYERIASDLAGRQTNSEFGGGGNGGGSFGSGGLGGTTLDFETYNVLSKNQVFKDSIQSAHLKSLEVVTDQKLTKKVENEVFPRVKKIMIEKVKANVADEKVRNAIIRKIENISYQGSDCSSLSKSSESTVNGLMIENAFYSPNSQTFRFCNGFLLHNSSEFAMAMIIAHELSHSIDPCWIDKPEGAAPITYSESKTLKEYESEFPFKNILSCLRSKESIGSKTNPKFGAKTNEQQYGNPFCRNDQIGESFSDWMGSEILPEYISKHHSKLSQNQKVVGYSNVFRNFCGDFDWSDFEVHPDITKRIDRIIMANHDVRKQVGCGDPKNDVHQCKTGEEFTGTRAMDEVKEKKTIKFVVKPKSEPTPNSSPTELQTENGGSTNEN
jgi:hypothetical protein